jgi:adenylate cyclase
VRRLVARPAIAMALAVAAVAGGAGTTTWATGLLDRLELAGVDALYETRADRDRAADVAVVAIDEQSLNSAPELWPFRRVRHARMVDALRRAGVRAIAYDVQFTEPSETPGDDVAFAEAILRARRIPVVLATTEYDEGGRHYVFGGASAVRSIEASVGNAAQLTDSDGKVRRYALGLGGHETFAATAAREALRTPAVDVPGEGLIDFPGGPGTVPTYSFGDVLDGTVDASKLRDRVVVVGATAPTLHDLHATGTSGDGLMNGPELQAATIQTLLSGAPLRDAPTRADVAFILVAALAGALGLALPRRRLLTMLVPVLTLAALLATIVASFQEGRVLPITAPLLSFVVAVMLTSTLLLSHERHERARQRLRDAYARFVPEQAVEELLEASGGVRALRGVEREATVMFADLRGFTARSQSESAQDVIEFLNRYLAQMSEAILAHGGTVVSYMGDGLMAVFGAPLPQPDHADRALAAAREMLGPRLEAFNAWLTASGGEPVGLSVGLHSGSVASGTVGSERRLEYAAVGHTTNVAARLESLTRTVGCDLLLSDTTRTSLRADAGDLVAVGPVEVKGVDEPVLVWSVGGSGLVAVLDQGDEAHAAG